MTVNTYKTLIPKENKEQAALFYRIKLRKESFTFFFFKKKLHKRKTKICQQPIIHDRDDRAYNNI